MRPEILERQNVYDGYLAIDRLRVRLADGAIVLARYRPRDRVSAGGGNPSEHEGIQVVERALPELGCEVDAGRITDGKLVTLIFALRLREPGLFL